MRNNKPIPFNTGKVLIGSAYEPKAYRYSTQEDDFWQGVLLGEHEARRIQRIQFVCYLVVVAGMFVLVALTLGDK